MLPHSCYRVLNGRREKYFIQWFIVIVVVSIFLTLLRRCEIKQHRRASYIYTLPTSLPKNQSRYDEYCMNLNRSILLERPFTFTLDLSPSNSGIPFFYSSWKSTNLMPRLISPCDHALTMYLLSLLINHVFHKYRIEYMMMAGTLLGSYIRHDMLPWDDDVDLRVSLSDRKKLHETIFKELAAEPYSVTITKVHSFHIFDKVYFSWCAQAGNKPWNYPFIDIFYDNRNSTHVWQAAVGQNRAGRPPGLLKDIFPLVLRPFGPLWLYAPRGEQRM